MLSRESLHYKRLFEKEASSFSDSHVLAARKAMLDSFSKQANAASIVEGIHPLVAAAAASVPAYMLGKSLGRDEEKSNIPKYLLGGAAAGIAVPKLLGMLTPNSMMGFDAEDIKELKEDD
jgi:hypothetical protein